MNRPDPPRPAGTAWRMEAETDVRTPMRLVAAILGLLSAGLGLAALFGWGLDARQLTSFGHGLIPMAPNTALLFVVLGGAQTVLTAWPGRPWLGRALRVVVLAALILPVLNLLENAADINTGIDALLFQTTQTLGRIPVGRMSPVAALAFLLAGAGLLLGEARAGAVCILGILVSLVGQVIAAGYIYRTPLFYDGGTIPLALPTALAFAVLGASLVFGMGPEAWPMRSFLGPTVKARLLRWILPPIPLLMLADDAFKGLFIGPANSLEVLLTTVSTVVSVLLVGSLITFNARRIGGSIDDAIARQQEARAEWERTFDTITDMVFIVGTDNRIMRANNALCARLALPLDAVIGRDCGSLLGWQGMGNACLTDAFLHGKAFEISFGTIPGSFLGSRSPLKNAEGVVHACVFVVSDISQYKSMQTALYNIEEQHRRIIDNAVVGVFQSSMEGMLLNANPALAAMFGYESPRQMLEDIKDIGRQSYVHPEDRRILKETLARTGQIRDFEIQQYRRDGSIFWVRLNGRIVSGDGTPPHIEGFLQDITEGKEAMLRLTDSEARFRSLAETMAQGLAQVDAGGRITYCNKHFCGLLQRPEGEILGRRPEDFLDEADQARFSSALAGGDGPAGAGEPAGTGEPAARPSLDAVWRNADGDKVFSVVSPLELRDQHGAPQGFWLLVMDVTRRKLLESQLLQSQKLEAIGQLAAGIAHEINTPAQYVGNNVQFIKNAFEDVLAVCHAARHFVDEARDAPPSRECVAALENVLKERDAEFLAEEMPGAIAQTLEGVDRISTIVRSVKQFAHPGALVMAPADLNESMRSTATVSRNEWKYVAELDLDLDPALPLVECMVGEINQVVLNLIINAAHAIADAKKAEPGREGRITLSTHLSPPWAEIRVADTGTGIPEDVQSRIFDPFFTTKEVGRGTGQGLTISRSIVVDKHRGELFFETAPGRGATFVVRLPLEQGRQPENGHQADKGQDT